jgi:hypothetical protein
VGEAAGGREQSYDFKKGKYMTNGPSSQHLAASAGLAPPALAGAFAFKFSGYENAQGRPFFLTGLGHFQIDARGNLTGTHRSSIMPIQGQDVKLETAEYRLTGTINIGDDGIGTASILFTNISGVGLDVDGTFNVQAAGVDRLWLISSGGTALSTPSQPANELVQLEAVRVA